MPYYDESTRLLDLRVNSITTIQACVLLGAISTTEDHAITESVYYTVACRMATLLEIARKPVQDPLEREVNIRGEFFQYVAFVQCVNYTSVVDSMHGRCLVITKYSPSTTDASHRIPSVANR